MNILDPFRRFLSTHLDFCAFSVDKCNATVKTISSSDIMAITALTVTLVKNSGSFKKYSKFTPTIHIKLNSYSFRIMFILIIVRSFIICFINGWKYEKVATNWDRVTNLCVYFMRCVSFKSVGKLGINRHLAL